MRRSRRGARRRERPDGVDFAVEYAADPTALARSSRSCGRSPSRCAFPPDTIRPMHSNAPLRSSPAAHPAWARPRPGGSPPTGARRRRSSTATRPRERGRRQSSAARSSRPTSPTRTTSSAAVAAATEIAPLRTCIHCAGIGWAERTINRNGAPHDLDTFRKVIEINLIGTFNVLRLAASGDVGERARRRTASAA